MLNRLLATLLMVTCFIFAAEESEEDAFPVSLVELAPQLSFLSQTWPIPIGGGSMAVDSSFNPGGVIRFTPIWRKKFPIFFHFGFTQVVEQNNSGYTINGEHRNLKYIWTYGSRFGFRVLPRWIVSTGLEFNHEPFLFDTGGQTAYLNKVLIPTLPIISSYEFLRTSRLSMLADVGVKAYFTVPMDWYLFRNGLVLLAKVGARWKLNSDFVLSSSIYAERRAFNTTVGDVLLLNLGFEVALGWGYGA